VLQGAFSEQYTKYMKYVGTMYRLRFTWQIDILKT
jgi:hypothetical protein